MTCRYLWLALGLYIGPFLLIGLVRGITEPGADALGLSTVVVMGFTTAVLGAALYRSSNKTLKPALVCYSLIAVSFACLYYFLFQMFPNFYVLQSGVDLGSQRNRHVRLYRQIETEYDRLSLLLELRTWVGTRDEAEAERLLQKRTSDKWVLPSGTKVEHEYSPADEYQRRTVIFEKGSNRIRFGGLRRDRNYAEVSALLREGQNTRDGYLWNLQRLIDAYVGRLGELQADLSRSISQKQLSLSDFVYFSFVTVTMLGYGHIIPNSIFVRLLVMGQILTGVFLILATRGHAIALTVSWLIIGLLVSQQLLSANQFQDVVLSILIALLTALVTLLLAPFLDAARTDSHQKRH